MSVPVRCTQPLSPLVWFPSFASELWDCQLSKFYTFSNRNSNWKSQCLWMFQFQLRKFLASKKGLVLVQTQNIFQVVLAAVSHFQWKCFKLLKIAGNCTSKELTEFTLLFVVLHIFALNSNINLSRDSSVILS